MDEKNFVVDPCYNPQNDRFICVGDPAHGVNDAGNLDKSAPHPQYVACTKKPASLMFFASTGEFCLPIWFPEGFRLTKDDYIAVLWCKVLAWMRRAAAAHASLFCFQQGGAPARTSKKTVAFRQEENVPFWGPTMWLPSSPDLNPLVYAVWSYVQQEACRSRPSSLTAMKRQVSMAWNRIPPEKIRRFCVHFHAHLERVVAVKGGIMED